MEQDGRGGGAYPALFLRPMCGHAQKAPLTGPHDGTTLYEQAIDLMIQNDGLNYIVSAGRLNGLRASIREASHARSDPGDGERACVS